MKSLIASLLMLLAVSVPCWAGSFSFDFNDNSTQFGYVQKIQAQAYGDTVAKVRYLYNDHTDTNLAGVAGGVIGTPGNIDGLKLGIDVALNGGQATSDQKFMAFGIGLSTQYAPPVIPGFDLEAHLVYSPEIFTFLDCKDYFEWGFGAGYHVLPNAKVTLAFQNIQTQFKNTGNYDLDETVRFGVSFSF
ncbi:YfaZ family outer membrane protein [Geopsychrobacter electrodiphilus]|uniref:YfaZ family outer membrane protein n=1 Tax=Geopsychrobacter electrodiphilus TaxID=225196 RepID=UPI00037BFE8C|nr:YfaZ family outer membrane protein [Geopsychrobacter electrodiphilus]